MNATPTWLHDIRPAQAGAVLLGRPECGHIAATIVDLALRDVLRVEQLSSGTAVDWLLTRYIHSTELTAYEKTLLEALFGDGDRLWLAEFTDSRAARMHRVGAALRHDAVRAGWLSRWRKGEQTKLGEQVRSQIQDFRRALRDDGLPAETESLRRALPYAVAFGLVTHPEQVPPPYRRLVSFALDWTRSCEDVPGWRPRLIPPEPSSTYAEHYYPPPSGSSADGMGLGGF